ncbi:hypothetical protein HU200_019075 [Digitaria exilis]|uniref:Uncharacterized protein n=1 Tax=Digitaria exilis TaxID=1010633 RepID=A0A835F468_9POAL|nr:hypothetical protein HU200_019075 [Digitaria exilis]
MLAGDSAMILLVLRCHDPTSLSRYKQGRRAGAIDELADQPSRHGWLFTTGGPAAGARLWVLGCWPAVGTRRPGPGKLVRTLTDGARVGNPMRPTTYEDPCMDAPCPVGPGSRPHGHWYATGFLPHPRLVWSRNRLAGLRPNALSVAGPLCTASSMLTPVGSFGPKPPTRESCLGNYQAALDTHTPSRPRVRNKTREDPTPPVASKPSRLLPITSLSLSFSLVGGARDAAARRLRRRSQPKPPPPAELTAMAATADRRAKPPAAPPHHLEPWAHQPPPAAAHRMPVLPAVASPAGGGCAAHDRRRSSSHRRGAASQVVGEETYDGGIEALRAKLMGHLRDAADRLRVPHPSRSPSLSRHPPPPPPRPKTTSPPTETEPEPELRAPPPPPAPPQQQEQQADAAATRPWNLRERSRRRPAPKKSWAASPSAPPPPPSSRRRRKRAPFSVSLTSEEIEEDVYSLTGARPRRRPRKRPRAVQRQLDVRRTPRTAPLFAVPRAVADRDHRRRPLACSVPAPGAANLQGSKEAHPTTSRHRVATTMEPVGPPPGLSYAPSHKFFFPSLPNPPGHLVCTCSCSLLPQPAQRHEPCGGLSSRGALLCWPGAVGYLIQSWCVLSLGLPNTCRESRRGEDAPRAMVGPAAGRVWILWSPSLSPALGSTRRAPPPRAVATGKGSAPGERKDRIQLATKGKGACLLSRPLS